MEINNGVNQSRRYKDAVMPDDGGERRAREVCVHETKREEWNNILQVVTMASEMKIRTFVTKVAARLESWYTSIK